MSRTRCAILGSGNIGTDLLIKIERLSCTLEVAAVAGIDPQSAGLRYAARRGLATTREGINGLVSLPQFAGIGIVFDATSASAHAEHDRVLRNHGKQVIDLTPAALGPGVVPSVNLGACAGAPNVSMISCGGQATIPIVAAVARCAPVYYAEIVASIASRSAGAGTRANIDEFTEATARAIVDIGGARHGKAIIILNPAEPPLVMRDTVYCLCEETDKSAIAQSVARMVADVQAYVPGYRLKQEVQFEHIGAEGPLGIPGFERAFTGLKVSVFLEVEGAGHHLPRYAGNLDIMTSAALRTAECIADGRRTAAAP